MRASRFVRQLAWRAEGRLGRVVRASSPHRLTVVAAFFHETRMRHAEALARNILRCDFVERLVLSNHNPAVPLAGHVRFSHPRLVIHEEAVPRGCGHRWHVAHRWDADYVMVIDDDILLHPEQVRALFAALVAEPGRPHGIAGLRRAGSGFEFIENRDCDSEYLCEVYAVTRQHLERYVLRRDRLPVCVRDLVDGPIDFALVSRAGSGLPRLHDVGHVLRCESFKAPGIAVHQQPQFWDRVAAVTAQLEGEDGPLAASPAAG